MFEEYLYLANTHTTSHNIMSRTNREQSSRAMATTVMKFKGQFKNIWAPPQKKQKVGLNFPLKVGKHSKHFMPIISLAS